MKLSLCEFTPLASRQVFVGIKKKLSKHRSEKWKVWFFFICNNKVNGFFFGSVVHVEVFFFYYLSLSLNICRLLNTVMVNKFFSLIFIIFPYLKLKII